MPRTIIHIGMPRAASTYFQQEVFQNISGFLFVGIETSHYGQTFQQIMYADDSNFDLAQAKKELQHLSECDCIISNEVFVGQSRFLCASNRSRTAARFKQIFPDAEIMIVLRNQASLLQSLYAIDVYAGCTKSATEYIKFTEEGPSNIRPENYPTLEEGEATAVYFYSSLIATYTQLFSKVHLSLFEDFTNDSETYLKELESNMGIEIKHSPSKKRVNSSLTKRQIRLIRMLNLWKPLLQSTRFGSMIFKIKIRFIEHQLGGKKAFEIDSKLRDALKSHYRADNRKLKESLPELNSTGLFEKYYC